MRSLLPFCLNHWLDLSYLTFRREPLHRYVRSAIRGLFHIFNCRNIHDQFRMSSLLLASSLKRALSKISKTHMVKPGVQGGEEPFGCITNAKKPAPLGLSYSYASKPWRSLALLGMLLVHRGMLFFFCELLSQMFVGGFADDQAMDVTHRRSSFPLDARSPSTMCASGISTRNFSQKAEMSKTHMVVNHMTWENYSILTKPRRVSSNRVHNWLRITLQPRLQHLVSFNFSAYKDCHRQPDRY